MYPFPIWIRIIGFNNHIYSLFTCRIKWVRDMCFNNLRYFNKTLFSSLGEYYPSLLKIELWHVIEAQLCMKVYHVMFSHSNFLCFHARNTSTFILKSFLKYLWHCRSNGKELLQQRPELRTFSMENMALHEGSLANSLQEDGGAHGSVLLPLEKNIFSFSCLKERQEKLRMRKMYGGKGDQERCTVRH